MNKSGIVLVDKKPGMTTLKDEMGLRKKFHTLKTGHAGTLDPFASGLLVIGINQGTKVLSYFDDNEKTYIATLKLGMKMDTGDKDGKAIETRLPSSHTKEEILEVFNRFTGEIEQIPPMYSALKKDGVPLYRLAYEGVEVKRTPRKVFIRNLTLHSYDEKNAEIVFEAEVSRGTYIRTLGEDIAQSLNELGYLSELRRTKTGSFDIRDAKEVEDITEDDIIPIAALFPDLPHYKVNEDEIRTRVYNGADLKTSFQKPYPKRILLVRENGEALSIYTKADDNWYKPEKQFFTL